MTTIPGQAYLSTPASQPIFPYWTVNIFLKDHNGHSIINSELSAGNPDHVTIAFLVTNGSAGAAFALPSTSNDDESTVAAPTNTSLLAALKTWAENQDWNTGYDWSNTATTSGATVTPVSFDSINITEVTGTEFTGSDITPA